MGRTPLLAISLGIHLFLGYELGSMPPRQRHQVIPITMTETKPAKPAPPKKEPPKDPEPEPPPKAPVRAKAAPPPAAKAEAPAAAANAPPSMDALPDFGVALTGGAGGVPFAAPGPRAAAPSPTSAARALARAAATPDDCGDPPAKPHLLSRPVAAYTDAARAAGVAGKVRVEISVDERGHIVSVRVIQGLGYGLDESALAAARALSFEPALRCGKPRAATFKIGFTFAP